VIILSHRQLTLFLFLDFIIFSGVLLLFTYYGTMHLFLALLGMGALVLGIYDISTGALSHIFSCLLGIPGLSNVQKRMVNFLPLIIAAGLLIFSVPQFWRHGFVNRQQMEIMQQFNLSTIVLGLFVACMLLAVLATTFYLKEARKDSDK